MQKSTKILLATLNLILIFGLTGCANNFNNVQQTHVSYSGYNKHYKGRVNTVNLPADYPTRALPDGDLWEDIRSNLQLYNYANVRQVKNQIYWFQTHQSYLNRTFVRGAQYMYFINQLIKKYHLPSEIILIPVFESGYNPVNRNHSSGASGLWQFMAQTARGYGVKINNMYEGRYDPVQSSYAAMKHFSYLHYFFNNDWTLTIAAYDAGEGTIQNAMFRNQRRGLPTDYWSLRFPRYETYEYVPKLLALSAIVKNPEKYGITLPAINNGPYFQQINVGSSMNLEKAARLTNTSVSVLHNLNPGLIRYRIPTSGPFVLNIPVSKIEFFTKNISGKNIISETEKPEQTKEQPIASNDQEEKNQSSLQMQNSDQNNSEEKNNEDLKQNLAKQAGDEKATLDENANDDNNTDNVNKKDESDEKPVTENNNAPSEAITNSQVITKNISIKVKKNDTIFSIAKRYHTSAAKIRKTNHLHSNKISVGQNLIIVTKQIKSVKQTRIINNDNENSVITSSHKFKSHSNHHPKPSKHKNTISKVTVNKVSNKLSTSKVSAHKKSKDDWQTIPTASAPKHKIIKTTNHSHSITKTNKSKKTIKTKKRK